MRAWLPVAVRPACSSARPRVAQNSIWLATERRMVCAASFAWFTREDGNFTETNGGPSDIDISPFWRILRHSAPYRQTRSARRKGRLSVLTGARTFRRELWFKFDALANRRDRANWTSTCYAFRIVTLNPEQASRRQLAT